MKVLVTDELGARVEPLLPPTPGVTVPASVELEPSVPPSVYL